MKYRSIKIEDGKIYSISEAAELVGTNYWTLQYWCNQKFISCVRIGPKQDRYFSTVDIIRLVNVLDYREEGYILSVAASKAAQDVEEFKYIETESDKKEE